ncbi:MAG: hypothetical protein AAF512_23395, partial [Pseudomonadota bacterium]
IGAWFGLGSFATVDSLRVLLDEFSRDLSRQPLKRHALYRAIDISLTTLETTGDTSVREVLLALPDHPHLGVQDRIQWTIDRIAERLEDTAWEKNRAAAVEVHELAQH